MLMHLRQQHTQHFQNRLFVFDAMFLHADAFIYDPNYASWQQSSGTDGAGYANPARVY
jgi:hypothetical protein